MAQEFSQVLAEAGQTMGAVLLRKSGIAIVTAALTLAACVDAKSPAGDATRARFAIPLRTYSFSLPNGMEVILDTDRHSPIVSINISYRVGGRDDPPHRSGFAHLFEHLMF